MRGECKRAKHIGESTAAHVEASGIGAEGRHYQPLSVAREAAPTHAAAAHADARHRMQVPGDLAGGAGRLMTECQGTNRQHCMEAATDAVGRFRVVIAGDPDPLAPSLERGQRGAVRRRDPPGSVSVVETVAERDHHARRIAGDESRDPRERPARIIWRQQDAARREARAFFQMQVGDREDTFLRPVERARAVGDERDAMQPKLGVPIRSSGWPVLAGGVGAHGSLPVTALPPSRARPRPPRAVPPTPRHTLPHGRSRA